MRLKAVRRRVPISQPSVRPAFSGDTRDGFPWEPEIRHYEIVDSIQSLRDLAERMKTVDLFAFDTETNTLEARGGNPDFKCVCITISWGEYDNYYIPLGHDRDEDIHRNIPLSAAVEILKPLFEGEYNTNLCLAGHGLKFDMHVLARLGIGFKVGKWEDTMLMSWLCNENTPNGLKENAMEHMGISAEKFKEVVSTVPSSVKKKFGLKANSKATYNLVLIDDGAPYALADSFNTFMLLRGFHEKIREEGMEKIYRNMYLPFLKILYEMEERGVTVDYDKLSKMSQEMQKDIDSLTYRIFELSGVEFNIGSSQQKAELLFGWEKPYTPIMVQDVKDKPWFAKFQNIQSDFKAGRITAEEVRESVSVLGLYVDDKGNLWKPSNRNEHILKKSFRFPVLGLTEKGVPSTDADTIWRLSRHTYTVKRKQEGVELCKLLLVYSKITKLKDAFADGLMSKVDSLMKIHPNFNQIGTDSGRLSCSDPNLQQLPNASDGDKYQIRDVFIGSEYCKSQHTGKLYDTYEDMMAAEGHIRHDQWKGYVHKRKKILTFDYHNLEMVCLAYFSEDKHLCTMFANDDDAHGSTAVNMFGLDCTPVEAKKKYPHLRQAAKTINFMLMYGGGAGKLYESLATDQGSPLDLGDKKYLEEYGCRSGIEVAQKFIDRYFSTYSGVANFIRGQKKYAHRNGKVYTILGRKRRLPDINSCDGKKSSKAERLSVNASIQGTAADITINAQIRLSREPRLKELLCDMLLQIHDEIVFEIPEENIEEAIPIIKGYMEHPFGDGEDRSVPYLRADSGFGNTYQEAK